MISVHDLASSAGGRLTPKTFRRRILAVFVNSAFTSNCSILVFILDTPLTSPATQIIGTYDPGLVTLSVIIAVLSAYAALDLAGRVTSAHGRARHFWLIGGAVTMGIGIWSMHYLGMLAFRMTVPVEYRGDYFHENFTCGCFLQDCRQFFRRRH